MPGGRDERPLMSEEDQSKKAKSQERRAKIAARATAEKRKAKRRRALIGSGVVLAVVAIIALVAAMMISNRAVEIPGAGPVPAAANVFGGINTAAEPVSGQNVDTAKIPAATDGIPAGIAAPAEGEPASVVVYVDPNCVHCAEFETIHGPFLTEAAAAGSISLEMRNIAILDRNSPTNYSSRASNALACVADAEPAKYLEYSAAVFANYPNGELANQKLVDLAAENGVNGIEDCVKDGKFRPFVKFTTEAATEHGITGTPTIFINGEMWDLKGDFEAIVNAAAGK